MRAGGKGGGVRVPDRIDFAAEDEVCDRGGGGDGGANDGAELGFVGGAVGGAGLDCVARAVIPGRGESSERFEFIACGG